jgi:DNA-directed RNA polymerase specialized sigma24 family protein
MDERAEWLTRWQEAEDREALDKLPRHELAALLRALQAKAGSLSAGSREDLAQEAVARLLSAAPEFECVAQLRHYLWAAARSASVDRLRARNLAWLELDAGTSARLALCQDPRAGPGRSSVARRARLSTNPRSARVQRELPRFDGARLASLERSSRPCTNPPRPLMLLLVVGGRRDAT